MLVPKFITIDGKATDWSYHFFSPKSKKIAFFTVDKGKTEEYPANKTTQKEIEFYSNLRELDIDDLKDSDVIVSQLINLGLPITDKGQVWVKLSGAIKLSEVSGKLVWGANYYNKDEGWIWVYLIDMKNGEVLQHKKTIRPIIVDFETGQF